jgi:roadblock/LC7 domain-containing protein
MRISKAYPRPPPHEPLSDSYPERREVAGTHCRKLRVLDGVVAVCRFQNDGPVIDHAGLCPDEMTVHLARLAHWYRRMVLGNTDFWSLFSQMCGWSPSQGWIVAGQSMLVCGMGNTVLIRQNDVGSLNEVLRRLQDAAHWQDIACCAGRHAPQG